MYYDIYLDVRVKIKARNKAEAQNILEVVLDGSGFDDLDYDILDIQSYEETK